MKTGVIVIGAGGHAKVCIEILQSMGTHVAYCIGQSDSSDLCLDIPVLKGDDNLARLREQGFGQAFIAIGSNRLREHLGKQVVSAGFELLNAISPQACVSRTARLGVGVAVMAGAVVNAQALLGDLSIINTGATVDHDCQIGPAVHLGPQCALAGNVQIGARSFLGVGCKVIPAIQIGEDVTVGAGGVVIDNLSSGQTAVGIPARALQR